MNSNKDSQAEKILISFITALMGIIGGIYGMAVGKFILGLPVLATGLLGVAGLYHIYDKPNKEVINNIAIVFWFISFIPVLISSCSL
jgi:hypothetical protein